MFSLSQSIFNAVYTITNVYYSAFLLAGHKKQVFGHIILFAVNVYKQILGLHDYAWQHEVGSGSYSQL